MEWFRGYVPTKNKQCLKKFKGVPDSDLMTLEEVENLPEYAGILAEDAILIDIDDMEQSEILMNIVEDLQLNCRVYQTTRGRHFLFRNNGVDKCATHIKLACGLEADIKAGCKPSYEVLKFNGEERFIEWDSEEYDDLPKFLIPVSSKMEFLDMQEGDGRDSALFGYELVLQSSGLNKEESIQCIQIINKYILKDKMSDEDIERITRDEAFQKPIFFVKNLFQHDKFANYVMNDSHIISTDGTLHIYQDGVYKFGTKEIEKVMLKHIPSLKANQRMEVIKYMSVLAPERNQTSCDKIAFRNGILDVDIKILHEFSPEYVITNRIPWDYNPNAYCVEVDETLNRISCNDQEIRNLLEECIGYCFYRINSFQKAFILTGSGSNGKSTFISMLHCILGDENVSALDLKNLGDRFSKATLYKKLANIGDDISDEFIQDPSLFKKIVSGDRIQAEYKGQDAFEFNPYVKLVFSANNMPRIRDKTGAVLRRLVIIPFNAVFSEDDPDHDPDIMNKLATQEAMEYLVKVGVEGLRRLKQNRKFSKSTKVEKELDEYKEFNNPVLGFIREKNEEQGEDFLFRYSASEIYLQYDIYCSQNGLQAESNKVFGKTLRSLYQVESIVKKVNGKSVRMYAKVTTE